MNRILIVNVNWLGDTIFVTPFIKAIRDSLPNAYIAVLTHPRCKEVLENNPYINEIIFYEGKTAHRNLLAKFALISELKAKKFDTAFILRRSLSRALLILLSGIPNRVGYDNRKSGFLLTKRISLSKKDLHKVEYFLDIAKAVGIEPKTIAYEFFISDKDREMAEELLKEEGLKDENFIAINPGGNWDLKRWPVENFAKLADEINSKFKLKVVFTGSNDDIGLCKKISGLMASKPILLCGKTNLKTLAGVFAKAKFVISNDSGPMHIASAVKANVIALFGPTSPNITGPHGEGPSKVIHKKVGCDIPCYNLSCRDNKCMKAISVKDVLEAIR